ncbi:MAG: BlaI/MecI/CopY family transcriptional regulator [Lachnospiraceae bacterium]|nr:BlaI/MecI/CopY family transcriptional regulator [Lachnospiraceae bacterium]MCD8124044.1 BlaI/MecI/CopY family transcriptional regulator [Lachnospiraceae bacterium]
MKFPKLTECELIVMKCIWDARRECKVSEVMQMLSDRGIHYKRTTVSTYLIHLKEKGYLRISREEKNVYYYDTAIGFEEYRKESSKNYMNFWYQGNVDEFLNDLV